MRPLYKLTPNIWALGPNIYPVTPNKYIHMNYPAFIYEEKTKEYFK